LTVRTEDDENIDYDFNELDELTHACAVTVHRAQGSEDLRGHPGHHQLMDDAAMPPALHRRHPGRETRRPSSAPPRPSAAVRVAGASRRHTALDHRLPTTPPARPSRPGRRRTVALSTDPVAVVSVYLSPDGVAIRGRWIKATPGVC